MACELLIFGGADRDRTDDLLNAIQKKMTTSTVVRLSSWESLKASRFRKPHIDEIKQPLYRVTERCPGQLAQGVKPCVAPSTATMVLSLVFVAWARIISSGLMK